MTATFDLKQRLQAMGLSPKRAFGQNFLVNPRVIEKIVATAEAPHAELVEVGPGLGALTEPLLAAGYRPRLIEFDPELVTVWRERGLDVTHADALKLDWDTLALRENSLLISNLPYNISTGLVVELCAKPLALKRMTLMFQREVAERLSARPRTKEYGFLSVMAQLHFRMTRVTDAAPRDFFPAPKVSSRVLHFHRLEGSAPGPQFLGFTKAAFAFRRKFLLKNLGAVVDKTKLGRAAEILGEVGFSEKARAEELAPGDFARLYRGLFNL